MYGNTRSVGVTACLNKYDEDSLKAGACSRYTDSVKKIFLTDFG